MTNKGAGRIHRFTSCLTWPVALAAAAFLATACGGKGADSMAASQASLVNDSGTLDLEVADRLGYASGTTTEGAIVEYIGDLNETFGSSGSGIFDSFLRLQDDGSESGYNTDGTLEFDTKSGAFTHSILVSDIPVVSVDGTLYWELFADINDNNSTPLISLNDLEVYFTADPDLTGYPFGANATKVYDFAGTIQINDVNQGSGRGDLRYRIPVAEITIPSSCGYKDPACTTYFVLYSQLGTTGVPYGSDGGFEEWKVKQYPYVRVSKTAATTFTRTFDWTIDKSVTPAAWELFTGDSGTSRYTVAVTKNAGTDSNWAVTGTITILNPGDLAATVQSVADVISGPVAATVDCGTLPRVLAKNTSLICTYGAPLPDGTARTNTATVALVESTVFTGTAPVTFGAPTSLVHDTINVTDTFQGSLGSFSATGSRTYDRKFTCDGDEGTHDNTATITETSQSDSARVTVNCHEITVGKTANTSFTRTYAWSIDKSADQTELELMPDQTFLVNYVVAVNTTGSTDSGWAAAGSITVHNPAPIAATINGVSDVITGPVAANVSCGVAFPYALAAGGNLVCSYSASLPNADARTNTATATRQNHDYDRLLVATPTGTTDVSGGAAVTFSSTPSAQVDECVAVTDTLAGNLGTACIGETLPKSFPYSRTVGGIPAAACGDHVVDNTGTFTANDTGAHGSDAWSVILHVLCPPPGCTLTQGYWKTHSDRGPAPYDDTWALLGADAEDTQFFTSGQSWYTVFWTAPKAGNGYYILAHQYMAAKLNLLNEAGSTATVDAALAFADAFFTAYDPADWASLTRAERQEVIDNAGVLASYNEGAIGPGHCSEDSLSSNSP